MQYHTQYMKNTCMKEQQEGVLAPQIYGYSKLVILAINHSGMKLTPHYYVFLCQYILKKHSYYAVTYVTPYMYN